MLNLIKNIFRKRCLKRERSTVPTGMMAPEKLRSAVVLLDTDDIRLHECTEAVSAFFREYGLRGRIFCLDLKSSEESEQMYGRTVNRKNTNWYGKPDETVTDELKLDENGLFLSLTDSSSFTAEYLAKSSGAGFKIGRRQLPGDTFDLVIKDSGEERAAQADIFREVLATIKKIK